MFNVIINKFKSFFVKIKNNKWNILLILLLLFVFKIVNKTTTKVIDNTFIDDKIKIFIQDGCEGCNRLENFLTNDDVLKYNIEFLNIKEDKNLNLLTKYSSRSDIPIHKIGTPAIFTHDDYKIGFIEKDGNELFSMFEKHIEKITNKQIIENEFIYSLKASLLSLFNFYTILFIIVSILIILLINNDRKAFIIITSITFANLIINLLSLAGWLNVYLIASYTRIVNLIFILFLMYYLIKNFYYLNKENKNILDTGNEINRHLTLLVTIMVFVLTSINITRNTGILNIDSSFYHTIYSLLSTLFLSIVLNFLNVILKKVKKNYLILNSILFLISLFVIFLMKY